MARWPAETSPERLTNLLRAAGALPDGRVTDVAIETTRATLISSILRLRLTYDPAAAGPSHVFVKREREDADPRWREFVRKEVNFYRRAAPETPVGLLPGCYEAVLETDGTWRLMLEDLTATHEVPGEWPLPPALAQVDAVLAAHARFHAQWWDHPRLGTIGSYADEDGTLDRFPGRATAEFAKFSDRLGDRLSAERRRIYERVIEATPRLGARYRTHRHLTLVHGDAHLWNAMFPREAGRTDVRLIDWDAWRVDLATDDLAYMLAVHCFPDWRARHERDRLERYHVRLAASGVQDYSLDALREDYRLSVLGAITMPMWQANYGIPAWVWWNHLERVFRAVDDLDCLALLD